MAKTSDGDTPADTPSGTPSNTPSVTPRVTPTEQIATTPSPVRASAAASGGATGLRDGVRDGVRDSDAASSKTGQSPEKPGIFRRHPLASGIAAGLIVVVVVSGLTAWGVGAAVTASLTNQTAPLAPPSTSTPAPNAGGVQGGRLGAGQLGAGRLALRATIQSIDDSNWTILTKRGQTVTIAITSSTKFGTKKTAETEDSFAVGDTVIVIATKADGSATAVRVATANGVGDGIPTPSPTSSATT
jgi:hypothetical protein